MVLKAYWNSITEKAINFLIINNACIKQVLLVGIWTLNPGLIASRKPQKPLKKTTFIILPDTYNRPD